MLALIQAGYLILSLSDRYCSAIGRAGDRDRYVFLEFQDGRWVVLAA